MSSDKIRALISLAGNAVIVIATAVCILRDIFRRRDGDDLPNRRKNLKTFRFFTTDSNVLAALTALILLPFELIRLTGGAQAPQWAILLKYAGTAAVAVTMLTVLVFLGPTQGYGRMLGGPGLWVHLICPLLAVITFLFFDGGQPICYALSLTAVLPVVIYGGVYLTEVIIVKRWEDFYGFNRSGVWYVSLALMLIGAFVVVLELRVGHEFFAHTFQNIR